MPRTPEPREPRTAFRSTAKLTPRTASAGSSKKIAGNSSYESDRSASKEVANAPLEGTQSTSEEDEKKAATRLKRIKQLIAEKKGIVSSNLKDSLREIVKKYPDTTAAQEANELLKKSDSE